jgi:Ser/Thr protein kinase RdoA (MazF antagonist)
MTISETDLKLLLERGFELSPIQSCRQFHHSFNTSYWVDTVKRRYVVRVIAARHRTRADLEAEVTLLTHLRDKGVPVQAPIPRRDGQFISELVSGERVIVLEFVEGQALFISEDRHMTEAQARQFGEVLARLHEATNELELSYDKPDLSLEYLLFESARLITEKLSNSKPVTYIQRVAQEVALRITLLNLPKESPVYGICHGDYFPGNAIWDSDGRCTIIDFDFAAPGYRAYDIGIFLQTLNARVKDPSLADALRVHFLSGYESIRRLSQNEIVSLAYFAIVSHLYLMRLRLEAHETFKIATLSADFWEKQFKILAWSLEKLSQFSLRP